MPATIILRPVGGPAYGAAELKQAAHRYGFLGFLFSVGIHSLIIGLYYLIPAQPYDPVKPSNPTVPFLPGIEVNTGFIIPSTTPTRRDPARDIRANEGTPVPVLEALASEEETGPIIESSGLGTSDEGEIGNGLAGGIGLGDGAPVIIDDDAPPPIYVPVEKNPQIVKAVKPVYPALAIKAGLEGTVFVKVWVDRQGKTRKAEILKSEFDIFNQSALEAAEQYIFTPAYMNGGAVSVWVSIPFHFILKELRQ